MLSVIYKWWACIAPSAMLDYQRGFEVRIGTTVWEVYEISSDEIEINDPVTGANFTQKKKDFERAVEAGEVKGKPVEVL